ncbi:hypothetical protein KM043_017743 [Ampulex compressa]|nr:hypothetical protein KM043_017743 [Ampulex compressa]
MDKEISYYKEKLQDCRKRYERVDTEIYGVKQLKNKASLVLREIEKKNSILEKDLEEIHFNYTECKGNADDDSYEDEIICANLNDLMAEKDRSKKEFLELKKKTESNDKKLMKVNELIAAQEKQNIALMQKLKQISEGADISEDLREKISAILNDSRSTEKKGLDYEYSQQKKSSE